MVQKEVACLYKGTALHLLGFINWKLKEYYFTSFKPIQEQNNTNILLKCDFKVKYSAFESL